MVQRTGSCWDDLVFVWGVPVAVGRLQNVRPAGGARQDPVAGRRIDRHDAIWEPSAGRPSARVPSSMVVSLAWFPRGEWETATAAWPDLLEDLPADHGEYSHRIEARLKRLARTLAGHPMRVEHGDGLGVAPAPLRGWAGASMRSIRAMQQAQWEATTRSRSCSVTAGPLMVSVPADWRA